MPSQKSTIISCFRCRDSCSHPISSRKHKSKAAGPSSGCLGIPSLLLDDLQDLHGAGLDADAAGNALGGGSALVVDHDLEGADLDALAAAGAQLLVDHVHAGLGILGDGTGLADLHALAALDADHGLRAAVLALDDLDAGLGDIIDLVECLGAGLYTLQTGHALGALLDRQLLHRIDLLFRVF